MEIIFELLAQLVLEVVVQGIFELGGRGIVSIFRRDGATVNPWIAICGYFLMGAIAGGLSIWLIPMHLLKSPALQILNLATTPIVLGFIFEALGRWKTNRDKPRYAVDRFSYGFTFALTMGLIRYFLQRDATHNMVFTLGLRHTFVLWQRALALVQSLVVQTSFASFGAVL